MTMDIAAILLLVVFGWILYLAAVVMSSNYNHRHAEKVHSCLILPLRVLVCNGFPCRYFRKNDQSRVVPVRPLPIIPPPIYMQRQQKTLVSCPVCRTESLLDLTAKPLLFPGAGERPSCIVCYSEPATVVFDNCGHVPTCKACTKGMTDCVV
jgi:hypothetical protein